MQRQDAASRSAEGVWHYGTFASSSGRITTLSCSFGSVRADEDGRRLAAIDGHMGHSRRKVQVVTGVGDVPML